MVTNYEKMGTEDIIPELEEHWEPPYWEDLNVPTYPPESDEEFLFEMLIAGNEED